MEKQRKNLRSTLSSLERLGITMWRLPVEGLDSGVLPTKWNLQLMTRDCWLRVRGARFGMQVSVGFEIWVSGFIS